MNKRLFVLVLTAICIFLSTSVGIYACTDNCENANFKTNNVNNREEIIISIDNENDYLNYSLNHNYRYTFISENSLKAVCYMCGSSTMGTITERSQYGDTSRQCPNGGLYLDDFLTWDIYARERCTACGYKSDRWYLRREYSAICGNGDNPWNGEWVVREEYTPAAGYNTHQSLNWWLYGIR